MSTALIAGLGIQGVATAYGLHVLGFDVIGVDLSAETIRSAEKTLGNLKVPIKAFIGEATGFLADLMKHGPLDSRFSPDCRPDIVVSSLPFHINFDLAKLCIQHGLRYCDLGGNVNMAERIRKEAEKDARFPVMTDLGLAPGIANIMAELGFKTLGRADSVKIRVGGLPTRPKGTLRYGMTFSPQGLYNEYRDQCIVIRNGRKEIVDPLTELEKVYFEEIGELEAFNTSGGISNTADSMLSRGVKECFYKTIRFPGHAELIRFLLFECRLDLEAFSRAMTNACGFIRDDQVLIDIEIADGDRRWHKRCRVLHDDTFTAMQKTTGFGAAAVAAIIGRGRLDDKKYVLYEDVATGDFVENMRRLLPETMDEADGRDCHPSAADTS